MHSSTSLGGRRRPPLCWALLLLCAWVAVAEARGVDQEPGDFVRESFDGHPPKPQLLWLNEALRAGARSILGHDLAVLRVRYWRMEERSAWILEEIGKEEPITLGVVIDDGAVERIKVLVFRESRGFEVRYPAFTDQFNGARLATDGQLDRPIDGITGATLSVRAVSRIARLALYLHSNVRGAP